MILADDGKERREMDSQTWPNAGPVHDEIDLCSPEGSDDAENIDAETVRARRFSTPTEIGLMRVGQDDDFCRIRNISTTGLMAQVYRAISVGDEVRVALKTGQSVKGRVVWAVDHIPDLGSRSVRQIGVSFDEPIDIKPVVSSHFIAETGVLQRWPRIAAECPLRLVLDSGRQIPGRLCDISQRGAKICTPHGAPGQATGSLILRGLPNLRGSVRWNDGPTAGMAFDVAIRLESLVQWIQDRRAEAFACQAGPGAPWPQT